MVKHEQEIVEIDACSSWFSPTLFSVILLGAVQTKCNGHDSYLFLSMVACYGEPAQSHVTGMTDALLGMLAYIKCLEKDGASPICNTKVLSCFCKLPPLWILLDVWDNSWFWGQSVWEQGFKIFIAVVYLLCKPAFISKLISYQGV